MEQFLSNVMTKERYISVAIVIIGAIITLIIFILGITLFVKGRNNIGTLICILSCIEFSILFVEIMSRLHKLLKLQLNTKNELNN